MTFTPNLSYIVDALPPEQAVIIKLKYFQDKNFREISELLNVPINTIMGRYRYAIDRIREVLVSKKKKTENRF